MQRCPLLQEVHAQHGLQAKWWSSCFAFRVVRSYAFHQRTPWNDLIHLLQENLLTGLFSVKIKVQRGLLHISILHQLSFYCHNF